LHLELYIYKNKSAITNNYKQHCKNLENADQSKIEIYKKKLLKEENQKRMDYYTNLFFRKWKSVRIT